jgi:hypothetical protein
MTGATVTAGKKRVGLAAHKAALDRWANRTACTAITTVAVQEWCNSGKREPPRD